MRIRDEILASIGLLLIVQLVTTFAAVGLLARMSPAIETILTENVVSIRAAADMQRALDERGDDPAAARVAFDRACARARGNITEPEERAVLNVIDVRRDAALAGDGQAVKAVRASLTHLADINHASMARADERAKRFGTAGAWAVALLGVLSFLASLFIVRRVTWRVLQPIDELHATLAAATEGDTLRRCMTLEAPLELCKMRQAINALLDRQPAPRGQDGSEAASRAALVALLDELPAPTVVLDRDGAVCAANAEALEALSGPQGDAMRAAWTTAVGEGAAGAPQPVARALGEVGWLVTVER